MLKTIAVITVALIANTSFASQTYFSCNSPVTGKYAFEGQELGVIIDTIENSMTLLNGSSDSIFPGTPVIATDVVITTGGPGGAPDLVVGNYISQVDGSTQSVSAKFIVGKLSNPALIYTLSEMDNSVEMQCFKQQ